jgi:hypothetical protein
LKHTYGCNDNGKLQNSNGLVWKTDDWTWFLHQETDRLYRKLPQSWEVRARIVQGRRTRTLQFGNVSTTREDPTGLIPVTIYKQGDTFKIDGKGSIKSGRQEHQTPHWYNDNMVGIEGNIVDLVSSMQNEQIIIMCDGSEKEGKAAAAWIISTKSEFQYNRYLYGTGHIPETDTVSHRAECFGILGGLLTWEKYQRMWDIHNTNGILFCDNKMAALTAKGAKHRFINAKMRDFDVLLAIRLVQSKLRITIDYRKGHPEREKSEAEFDFLDNMNCKADELAKTANNENNLIHRYCLPGEKWQLYIGNHKIHK